MSTLSTHARVSSLSSVSTASNVVANVAVRPCMIVSLLPVARGLCSRKGLMSRGPLRRHSCMKSVSVMPRASLGQLPDPEQVDLYINALSQTPDALQGLLSRTEGLFFTLADVAVATDPSQVTDAVVQKQDGGWLGGVSNSLEIALTVSSFYFYFYIFLFLF